MNSTDGKPIDTTTSTTQEPTLFGENCKPGLFNLGGLLCKKPEKKGEADRIIHVDTTSEGDKPAVPAVSGSSPSSTAQVNSSEKPMPIDASGQPAAPTRGGWFSRGGKRKSKAKKSRRKNRKQRKSRKSRK
jgi:hypothetical protein